MSSLAEREIPQYVGIYTNEEEKPCDVRIKLKKKTQSLNPRRHTLELENFNLESAEELYLEDGVLCFRSLPVIALSTLIEGFDTERWDHFKRYKRNFCNKCSTWYYHYATHRESEKHLNSLIPNPDLLLLYQDQRDVVIIVKDDTEEKNFASIGLLNNTEGDIRVQKLEIRSEAGHSYITYSGERNEKKSLQTIQLNDLIAAGYLGEKKFYLNSDKEISSSLHIINVHYTTQWERKKITLRVVLQKRCSVDFNIATEPKKNDEWKPVRFESTESPNDRSYVTKMPSLKDTGMKAVYQNLEHYYRSDQRYRPNRATDEMRNKLKRQSTKSNVVDKWLHLNSMDMLENIKNTLTAECKYVSTDDYEGSKLLIVNLELEKSLTLDLKKKDRVIVKADNGDQTYGKVRAIDVESIEIILEGETLNLAFGDNLKISNYFNQQTFTITHHALKEASAEALEFLHPRNISWPQPEMLEINFSQDKLTEEQKTCIKKILSHHDHIPFILTGAPGSGKSKILVEVSIQQVLLDRSGKVLICCPSNAALCTLQEKLEEHIRSAGYNITVTKISSPSAPVADSCLKYCTLEDGNTTHKFPTVERILGSHILLTTLQSSIRLKGLKHGEDIVDVRVSTIVSDEVCFASEAVAMIPVLSQLTGAQRKMKVVLCGDPKQLLYNSRSKAVNQLRGMDIITKLLTSSTYKDNNPASQHNLTENHRYPTPITQLLNKISYDNTVKSCACCGVDGGRKGLIKAIHVDSEYYTMVGKSNYSFSECMTALEEARKAKKAGLGSTRIVVYYKAQEALMTRVMKQEKYFGITLSTAESSQGDESNVVIVSPTIRRYPSDWHNKKNRLCMVMSRTKMQFIICADLMKMRRINSMKPLIKKIFLEGEYKAPRNVEEYVRHYMYIREKQ